MISTFKSCANNDMEKRVMESSIERKYIWINIVMKTHKVFPNCSIDMANTDGRICSWTKVMNAM